ncbi:MAG: efflux RND transporter permease subunit [bacterium]|nr:efflux RND transporter permease subunit [bacterium]
MKKYRGAIPWMARNLVSANLLMLVFIVGGLIVARTLKQEVFPEFDVDRISISVPYPGASPADVEQGILLSIEDEVRGIDGVKEVTSNALEGAGAISVELLTGVNKGKVLQDVKNAVDRITSFPDEAERPVVSLVVARRQVLSLIISGEMKEIELRNLAEEVRDELLSSGAVTLVEMEGARSLETHVEISQENLRKYGITLPQVAQAIRQTALELPAGAIKDKSGEMLLRTTERRDFAAEFESVAVYTDRNGLDVRLGDIAEITDGFADTDLETTLDGAPAVRLGIYRVGDETPISVSDAVHGYIEGKLPQLPVGAKLTVWNDQSEIYKQRIELLLKNAFMGFVLVLLLLGLFLEPRLAFWVTLGIPVSVLGSFLFLSTTGVSINMISLFAFIITLGIVVDDAIVVGENIYEKREKGVPYLEAALDGAKEIAMPVVFAVLTNIVAFMPLLFVPGGLGNLFKQVPAVVISILLVSLVESLFILPAHLSHKGKESRFWDILSIPEKRFEIVLHRFIYHHFSRVVANAIRYRYLVIILGISLLVGSLGLVVGGRLPFTFMPRIETDVVLVQARLAYGTPLAQAKQLSSRLLGAAEKSLEPSGGRKIVRGIYGQIGQAIAGGGPATGGGSFSESGAHLVAMQIFLVPLDEREVSAQEVARRWRENLGEVAGLEAISFKSTIGTDSGAEIDVQLSHREHDVLETAAESLAHKLSLYGGVYDVDDGVESGKPEMSFRISDYGSAEGFKVSDIAAQLRSSFYGVQALRQQRGRNEVKVLVRLPDEERDNMQSLDQLVLRSPAGAESLLSDVATPEFGHGYTTIRRSGGRRVISVTAEVDEEGGGANANDVVASLQKDVLPELLQQFPGLTYSMEGEQKSQSDSLVSLRQGFLLALLGIFALLAVSFNSYIQPLIVMLAIPFGIIGAVIGHILLGYDLSAMSLFGIIALAGVAVNDSLVLIVTANENKGGRLRMKAVRAMHNATVRRFRPVILTSLTTFFGLAPMIFETSMQARFLIPMAISLGFGILFSTVITLFIVPSIYIALEDFLSWRRRTSV